MITALTLTGDRRICLNLCRNWLANQTLRPDKWIVIDDGQSPYEPEPLNDSDVYFRREPAAGDRKPTIIENMRAALAHISGDYVFIIEDDEYYSPRYIETMMTHLQNFEVAGIGKSRYYHLPSQRYYIHGNYAHASLAQTAFRSSFLPALTSVLDGDFSLDYRLWSMLNDSKILPHDSTPIPDMGSVINNRAYLFNDHNHPLYCGMKGMPGRAGIGSGHKPGSHYTIDDEYMKLKEWIPLDYQTYIDLAGSMRTNMTD